MKVQVDLMIAYGPVPSRRLGRSLGITAFRERFTGTFVTETMLVAGINDTSRHVKAPASFLALLAPEKACLNVPTRPPAMPWAEQPSGDALVTYPEALCDQVENLLNDGSLCGVV